jgi:hypothetical protein
MDSRDSRLPTTPRYLGRREMQHLAESAVRALERSGHRDTLEALRARLFSRPPEELTNIEPLGDGVFHCHYKPMAELVLREVLEVTRNRRVAKEDQRARIMWALTMGGF